MKKGRKRASVEGGQRDRGRGREGRRGKEDVRNESVFDFTYYLGGRQEGSKDLRKNAVTAGPGR